MSNPQSVLSKKKNVVLKAARLISIIVVIGISIFVYLIRDHADELTTIGYPGIFLISLITNATVLLPAPGIAVVFTMGGVFNPIGVGISAGAGGALGELSGYMAGFSGQAVIENIQLYKRLVKWMSKNGPLTILLLAAIPNPFFDLAGMAAGVLKMPILRFLFFCWIGVTIKMLLFAWAGFYSITWLLEILH